MRPAPIAHSMVIACFLWTAEGSAQRPPHPPRAPPRACVQFVQHDAADGHGLRFEITNVCDSAIESVVDWRVVCGHGGHGGNETRHTPLAPQEQRVIAADASVCGEATWRIDGIHWSWSLAPV